jgi:hypothetical protein
MAMEKYKLGKLATYLDEYDRTITVTVDVSACKAIGDRECESEVDTFNIDSLDTVSDLFDKVNEQLECRPTDYVLTVDDQVLWAYDRARIFKFLAGKEYGLTVVARWAVLVKEEKEKVEQEEQEQEVKRRREWDEAHGV